MDRRDFVKGAGLGALSLQVLSFGVAMSPAEAAAQKRPFVNLSAEEAATLSAFADALVPGAVAAGVTHFIDFQLGLDPNDCLLMAKYFNVKPPYLDFYRAGIHALDAFAQATHGHPARNMSSEHWLAAITLLSTKNPPDWSGPPAPVVYLLVRSDAVDVVYGTEEGFKRLGIPYMAHIVPPQAWS